MPERTVMATAFSTLRLIVIVECRIVLNNIMCSIHQSIAKSRRTALGHTSVLRRELSRLVNGWIKSCEGKQLARFGKPVYVTDLTEDHPAIDGTNPGNGHDDRIESIHDVGDLSLD